MNYSFYVIVTTGTPEDTTIATVRTLINARYGFAPSEARFAWLEGNGAAVSNRSNFVDWPMRAEES